jgi:hypothetical protein
LHEISVGILACQGKLRTNPQHARLADMEAATDIDYREQAARVRRLADHAVSAELRERLLHIAEQYETLAACVERGGKRLTPSSS